MTKLEAPPTPLVSLDDFEQHATRNLDENALDYYRSGAQDMITLRENQRAFDPRRKDTCMVLSSWSTTSIEDVASATSGEGVKWMQLYVYKDREATRRLIERAQDSGYTAIALTVDTPYLGRRLADMRNRFRLPPHLAMANFSDAGKAQVGTPGADGASGLAAYVASQIDPSLNWQDVAWVKSVARIPVLVKGILTAEDATLAIEAGVDGIIVSNHGGRQLDTVPPTIDVLEEVCRAVQGRADVFLDGGVRRGTDVFKALALGARAVFLGRPVLWALNCNGEDGVVEMLDLINEELRLAMALAGCSSVADITRSHVRVPAQPRL
ncbi:Hydroxyacid oxidase 1 [Coemansia sp. BCRC 34301]|nr:Hydroxyacid oxidase 1 [Coemansia sp. BCRC 34301]